MLSYEEVTAARRNLQTSGVEVDNEFIRQTWHHVYRYLARLVKGIRLFFHCFSSFVLKGATFFARVCHVLMNAGRVSGCTDKVLRRR